MELNGVLDSILRLAFNIILATFVIQLTMKVKSLNIQRLVYLVNTPILLLISIILTVHILMPTMTGGLSLLLQWVNLLTKIYICVYIITFIFITCVQLKEQYELKIKEGKQHV